MCAYYCEPTLGYNEHILQVQYTGNRFINRRVFEYAFYLHMGSSCIIIEASCVVIEASCIVIEARCVVKKVTTHSLEI